MTDTASGEEGIQADRSDCGTLALAPGLPDSRLVLCETLVLFYDTSYEGLQAITWP